MSPRLSSLDRLRAWSPLLPLIFLLASAYWLQQQVQPLPPATDSSKRHDPDFMVDHFAATTLDQRGAPHFTMAAQKMVHYPDDDSTLLENLQLNSFYPDRPSIHISANEGKISGKGEEIFLSNEVKIIRAATGKQSELAVTTNYLHVVPDLDLATTNHPITLTDKYNIVHAVGMEFDNRARVIKLLSQVKSEHVPTKK